MPNTMTCKIFLIIIYLVIIILIPLFLDYLFKLTVRKKRKLQIKTLAEERAKETNKSLVIFNDQYHGIVNNIQNDGSKEEFTGDIIEIIFQMAPNSCVMVLSEVLEYIHDPNTFIEQIKTVSGNDLYTINIEKNSPRVFWDYKIKNVMNKSFYVPNENITWSKPNKLQLHTQNFYSYIFKILPYDLFSGDPVDTI